MLITTTNSDFALPVGILIKKAILSETEWQGFVLYPFLNAEKKIEIGIGSSKDKGTRTVAPEYETWKQLNEDVYGYPQPREIEEDVYKVWDDGAKRQREASMRLYEYFNDIINYYIPFASEEIKKMAEQKQFEQIQEAKANGWDTNLVPLDVLPFPYQNT